MATELAKAYVQIIPSARGIQGSLTKVLGGEAGSAGTSAGQTFGSNLVGKVLGIVSAAAIGKALASTITEGAALEQSIGGIETLFKDSADTVKANAAAAYSTAGMSANQYMEQTTSFAASLLQSLGGDTAAAADMADMAMRDMSDNSNKMGTDMERITDAYQGFAKQNYTMLDNLKLGYGGTKTEMERLLKDAQKITGVKYDIDNLADVYSAIHVIQGELDITGTTAQEAATTLSGSFYSMAAAGKNVLGNLTLGQDITPSLKALAQTTTTFLVGNLLPAVWNVLKALPGGMVTLVQEMGAQMAAQLPAFLAQFQTGMTTNLSQLITAGQTMLSGLIAGLMQNLPQLLQSGTQMVNSFVSGALATGTQLWTAGLSLLTQFTQGITANLPQILASATSIVANLVTGLNTALPQVIQSGIAFLTALGQGLVQGIPQFLAQALPLISQFTGSLRANVGQLVDAGISLILNLAQGLIAALPTLITYVPGIVSNIAGIINDNAPKLLAAAGQLILMLGQGLIQSLPVIAANMGSIMQAVADVITAINWLSLGGKVITAVGNGLTSMAGGLTGVMQNSFSGAVNYLKNLPAKAMSWGKDMISGFIKGITSNIAGVANAVKNIASAAASYLHFSRPDVGPLREYEKWMPDFLKGLSKGIYRNKYRLIDSVQDLGNSMASSLQGRLAYGMPMKSISPAAATTIQQYNTFNTHDSLSEAELTREAESMAKRLQWAIP